MQTVRDRDIERVRDTDMEGGAETKTDTHRVRGK